MEPVIFGPGFSQDATSFTISKTALASAGLIASASNKQEELLAALIIHWEKALTQQAWSTNAQANIFVTKEQPTLNSRTIGSDTSSFFTHQYQVSIATAGELKPSDM